MNIKDSTLHQEAKPLQGFGCAAPKRMGLGRVLQGAEDLGDAARQGAGSPGGAAPRDPGSPGRSAPRVYWGSPGGSAPGVA